MSDGLTVPGTVTKSKSAGKNLDFLFGIPLGRSIGQDARAGLVIRFVAIVDPMAFKVCG